MEAIRISIRRSNGVTPHMMIGFGDDAEGCSVSTHLLANSVKSDRVIFQLPSAAPHDPFFRRHGIPELVQSVSGVAIVRQITAARLFNERGGTTSIDSPERYRNPTFVAHLSNANTSIHPLKVGYFICDMVDLAYAPDAVISVMHTTPEVDSLGVPDRLFGLKILNPRA